MTPVAMISEKRPWSFTLYGDDIVPRTIQISREDYEAVKSFMATNEKISAIKHLRATSLINGDKTLGGPGLKEAKDFVEQHTW